MEDLAIPIGFISGLVVGYVGMTLILNFLNRR
jgi:hypothetical protein